MAPILQIGPLALRTPLLLTLLGLYLGLSLAERRLPKDSLSAAQLNTLVFLGLVSGVLAARLFFALQHFALFARAPLNLFSLDSGLLDPFAGWLVGILAMAIYGQRQRLSLWKTLDALTPLLAVLGVFLSLALFAAGEVYGTPTDLTWGIEWGGAKRHPLGLYSALGFLLILVFFWQRLGRGQFAGQTFLQFVLAAAALWLFLEAWRANALLLPGGFRAVQVTAWLNMAFAYWLLERRARGQG